MLSAIDEATDEATEGRRSVDMEKDKESDESDSSLSIALPMCPSLTATLLTGDRSSSSWPIMLGRLIVDPLRCRALLCLTSRDKLTPRRRPKLCWMPLIARDYIG
jgi:hypothetical protein